MFYFNVIWDKGYPEHRFIDTLNEISRLLLISAYHAPTSESFGKETKARVYWQKNLNQPYHIDYIFTSEAICNSDFVLEMKPPDGCFKLSEHVPIALKISMSEVKFPFREVGAENLRL